MSNPTTVTPTHVLRAFAPAVLAVHLGGGFQAISHNFVVSGIVADPSADELRKRIIVTMAGHVAESQLLGTGAHDPALVDTLWGLAGDYVRMTQSGLSERASAEAMATLIDGCRIECTQLVEKFQDRIRRTAANGFIILDQSGAMSKLH